MDPSNPYSAGGEERGASNAPLHSLLHAVWAARGGREHDGGWSRRRPCPGSRLRLRITVHAHTRRRARSTCLNPPRPKGMGLMGGRRLNRPARALVYPKVRHRADDRITAVTQFRQNGLSTTTKQRTHTHKTGYLRKEKSEVCPARPPAPRCVPCEPHAPPPSTDAGRVSVRPGQLLASR